MDYAAIVSPILALVAGAASLWVAQRLGVGPVQREYVDLLKGLNVTQKHRIDDLEADNARLVRRIEHLELEVGRLERLVAVLTAQTKADNK